MEFNNLKKELIQFNKNNNFYPISFSIPKCKILEIIPKEKDFARIVPGIMSTYGFKTEQEYMKDYSISKFGLTIKKSGWDCMRHLEIMAANCLPFFVDLCYLPEYCMYFYPKKELKIILENKDILLTNENEYQKMVLKIRNHLENYLTCESMINNIFNILEIKPQKILFIDDKLPKTQDYLSIMVLIGLKNNFRTDCEIAFPVDYLYKSSTLQSENMHGSGFNYAKVLDDDIKSENEITCNIQKIEENIIFKKYDLIVYGALLHSSTYLDYVLNNYSKNQIIAFIGEDQPQLCFPKVIEDLKDRLNLFIREIY